MKSRVRTWIVIALLTVALLGCGQRTMGQFPEWMGKLWSVSATEFHRASKLNQNKERGKDMRWH